MRITVVTWSAALGDTLLLVPALRSIRAAHPASSIHLIGAREASSLLMEFGLVDSVGANSDPRLVPLLGRSMHSGTQWLREALGEPDLAIMCSSAAAEADGVLMEMAIDHLLVSPFPPVRRHAAEHLIQAMAALGPDPEWRGVSAVEPLSPSRTRNKRIAVLHPGSGAAWKCAPSLLFVEVARRLSNQGFEVVALEGPADAKAVAACGWSEKAVRPRSVKELANLLARASLFVGNDSGTTHLAGLLGVPVVALYGPTHPATWGPLGPNVVVLRACNEPPGEPVRICPDPWCMSGIREADVTWGIEGLIGSPEDWPSGPKKPQKSDDIATLA